VNGCCVVSRHAATQAVRLLGSALFRPATRQRLFRGKHRSLPRLALRLLQRAQRALALAAQAGALELESAELRFETGADGDPTAVATKREVRAVLAEGSTVPGIDARGSCACALPHCASLDRQGLCIRRVCEMTTALACPSATRTLARIPVASHTPADSQRASWTHVYKADIIVEGVSIRMPTQCTRELAGCLHVHKKAERAQVSVGGSLG